MQGDIGTDDDEDGPPLLVIGGLGTGSRNKVHWCIDELSDMRDLGGVFRCTNGVVAVGRVVVRLGT